MTFAVVFPGQGSQSVGMLAELHEQFSIVKQTFDEASEVLAYDIWSIVQNGPKEKLNSTDVTQPAMLAAGIACWRVLQQHTNASVSYFAGHSLGEYTALVAANSLAFGDALKLVAERGRLMQQAVPAGTGAMAAILGLDDDSVIEVCNEVAQGEVVQAVNFNSPGQVVIAGTQAAVERAVNKAKQQGAKRALLLAVSVPSHCELMQPAAIKLAIKLNDIAINVPDIPVIQNVDVAAHQTATDIRDALTRQLFQAVRWVETIQYLVKSGVDSILECGPGKVLLGLNKRIDKSISTAAFFDKDGLTKAQQIISSSHEENTV